MSARLARGWRTRFEIRARTLVVDLGTPRPVLSSAVRGGGRARTRFILNHQVPLERPASRATRRVGDPGRFLADVAATVGVRGPFVGLMTAVPMRNLVTDREEQDGLWVEGFITVGVSNAVRAGERVETAGRPTRGASRAGTINIILITNARLTTSAMVAAVQVATESKTSVLHTGRVRSSRSAQAATGTGTDVTVIAGGTGPACRYSGTHTTIGSLIGRLVRRAVAAGLARDRARLRS